MDFLLKAPAILVSSVNILLRDEEDDKAFIMQHVIKKYGFTYCGIIYLESGDERFAYQLQSV